MFTSNAAAAAPVRLTRETSDRAHLRAVIVNAGNANACTGKQGLADAARMRLSRRTACGCRSSESPSAPPG